MSRTGRAHHCYRLWRWSVSRMHACSTHYWDLYLKYMEPRW